MDIMDAKKRSALMARIKSRNTKPERKVRSLLHALGFRFRLHKKGLPGKPDIVLSKHKTVVLVHGCYWHRHEGCSKATTPKSNTEFWQKKFKDNVERDKRVQESLVDSGWNVIVVWECETIDNEMLTKRLLKEIGY
jgi:DNA mismatch endonuclease (patch repair protein)